MPESPTPASDSVLRFGQSPEHPELRGEPRLSLPFMYCELRARTGTQGAYDMEGHIYDLSLSGLRFELDDALPTGARLELRLSLPGPEPIVVKASANVVRLVDEDDEPGPVRMGASFVAFRTPMDRERLEGYLAPRLGLSTKSEDADQDGRRAA
ncbi:MAG: PilZ domain-containing protein [Planctomycetota bacterium]